MSAGNQSIAQTTQCKSISSRACNVMYWKLDFRHPNKTLQWCNQALLTWFLLVSSCHIALATCFRAGCFFFENNSCHFFQQPSRWLKHATLFGRLWHRAESVRVRKIHTSTAFDHSMPTCSVFAGQKKWRRFYFGWMQAPHACKKVSSWNLDLRCSKLLIDIPPLTLTVPKVFE